MSFLKKSDLFARRLGCVLRSLRLERNLSLEQMVWAAELPGRCYLLNVEDGRSVPSKPLLARMAQVLGVHLDDLFPLAEGHVTSPLLELLPWLSLENIGRLLQQKPN